MLSPGQWHGILPAREQDLQPLSAPTRNTGLFEAFEDQTQAEFWFLFQDIQSSAPPDSHVRGSLIPMDIKMG